MEAQMQNDTPFVCGIIGIHKPKSRKIRCLLLVDGQRTRGVAEKAKMDNCRRL